MGLRTLKSKQVEQISTSEYCENTINSINNLLLEIQCADIEIKVEPYEELEQGELFKEKLIVRKRY